ncbi:acyl-CoA dehydrogenase family protein [Gammaproteobacteria bacterium]|nr:acyl-CoA dehydrogenase family protein [Gammaproteobacteria bacterium]
MPIEDEILMGEMLIQLSPKQAKLKEELQEYFEGLITPDLQAELRDPEHFEGGGPEFKNAMRTMGADGWIGLSWKKELGGKNLSPMEQYIFVETVMRTGFPFPFLTTESVGPMIAEHGSDWAKEEVATKILKGELFFGIGYSEPNSGTDLASLQTKAIRNREGYLINGQKMWTSLANFSDYIWLAARTDFEAKNHKGISMFIVPTNDPGFSMTAINTLGDVRTNATFYDNIHVPESHLVGQPNEGWSLITSQLNLERLALVNHGPVEELYKNVLSLAQSTKINDNQYLIDLTWVQHNFAQVYSGIEALKLICWKQTWIMESGRLNMAEASVAKVYGSEFFIEAYRLLMEIMGELSLLKNDSELSILNAKLERMYRTASILTFGGGTNEVQRDIIAMAGLLMPRTR